MNEPHDTQPEWKAHIVSQVLKVHTDKQATQHPATCKGSVQGSGEVSWK